MIDFTEFSQLHRRFPLVLFPAFRLQNKMQQITLGERAWVKINERIEMTRKKYEYREHDRFRKTILPKFGVEHNICPERVDAFKRGEYWGLRKIKSSDPFLANVYTTRPL